MIISWTMVLILIAILLIGIGSQYVPDLSPRGKMWTIVICFIAAACVVLYYAGVLRA